MSEEPGMDRPAFEITWWPIGSQALSVFWGQTVLEGGRVSLC
jgi:hypothetical protein